MPMKSTGIVRKMDELGRVVIPMELRRSMGLRENDPLEIFTDGNMIVLRKYRPGCHLCGGFQDLMNVEGTLICRPCGKNIGKQATASA